ncbi:arylsulfatase [Ruficoccus amylovorans]|uniref:Arylsulfatase n=1 Tax=Ruficoccus amylovorans TaxID=1804625 RepID=A0A842HCU1_9BACT|nr:arylsulfatase [Ruficoccus amylovorans]MBC2593516.1 arylsulfatase [Ruficoccus amylovorans]
MNINPRLFLLSCTLFVAASGGADAAEAQRPNVIYILADDLGYGDLSCQGQTKFETPNIDRLAGEGIRFTNHYSGSTVCAPSRCSLMTGMDMGHAQIRGNEQGEGPEGQFPMPEGTFTVANLFQQAGYRTGVFGKWGLGYPGSASDPLNVGFDRFYGYNCQLLAHSYYPAWLWNDNKREFLWGNVGSFSKDYAPAFIQSEVLNFIRENKDRPFFCYYAIIQPHADLIAPESYMEKHRGKYMPEKVYKEGYYKGQPEGHAAFAAMVNILDDYVGEVMAELEELGIADNTLVIFSSDNGPHQAGGADPDYFDSNGIYRGYKRDLYEGGIHMPFIATWPGTIEAGTESGHISAFWDFLPTVAELLDQPIPIPVDGISFLPSLLGEQGQKEHDYLYWEFTEKDGRKAIRKGKWKGVIYGINKSPHPELELYDLSNDPGETRDLAREYPDVVAELNALMEQARVPSANPKWSFTDWDKNESDFQEN